MKTFLAFGGVAGWAGVAAAGAAGAGGAAEAIAFAGSAYAGVHVVWTSAIWVWDEFISFFESETINLFSASAIAVAKIPCF